MLPLTYNAPQALTVVLNPDSRKEYLVNFMNLNIHIKPHLYVSLFTVQETAEVD